MKNLKFFSCLFGMGIILFTVPLFADAMAVLNQNKEHICKINSYAYSALQKDWMISRYWEEIAKQEQWTTDIKENVLEITKNFLSSQCQFPSSMRVEISSDKAIIDWLKQHGFTGQQNGLFYFDFQGISVPLYVTAMSGLAMISMPGIKKPGKLGPNSCLSLNVNEVAMNLKWVGVHGNACPIPYDETKPGTFLVRLSEEIGRKLGLGYIKAKDQSEVRNSEGVKTFFSALRIFEGKPTWYESLDFTYTKYSIDRDKMRALKINDLLVYLNELAKNKQYFQKQLVKSAEDLNEGLSEDEIENFLTKIDPKITLLEDKITEYSETMGVAINDVELGPFFVWLWRTHAKEYVTLLKFIFFKSSYWLLNPEWKELLRLPWDATITKNLNVDV
jgi:hypothetical protein